MLKRQVRKTMIDFDRDTAFAQRMLDALSTRTKATLQNVANQNVPGYKRYEVRFEDLLQDELQRGGDGTNVQPVVRRDTSGAEGVNNVVVMDELAMLAKTQLLHDVMTRRAGGYFATLNMAISGR